MSCPFPSFWCTQISMEDYETVAPAGTSSHKALTVLPVEWESTPVAMFVTSSDGHILPKEPASSAPLPPTRILASVFQASFCISASFPLLYGGPSVKLGHEKYSKMTLTVNNDHLMNAALDSSK